MNKKKNILTVFTPTYNRAELLVRGYEALCRQTSKDFLWLIIDDGSKDNTREVVEQWQKADNGFEIQYAYKENGGLHTGYNKAIEMMDTEICVCIDSDDWMPDDAVEIILDSWENYKEQGIAGMVGYDYTKNGKRLGDPMQEGKIRHYVALKEDKRYCFDNKVVMRVDLLKSVAPQPSYYGEKNFNPIWMILKIDQCLPFVLLDKTLCIVDYQADGMAANIINQYFNSPNSFLELRKLYVSLKYTSLRWKIRHHIHLISQSLVAGKNAFKETPNVIVTFIFYPLGFALFKYMNYLHRKEK